MSGRHQPETDDPGDAALQGALERLRRGLAALPGPVDVVVRDDDVTDRQETLAPLLELAGRHRTPLHLAVIPAQMTPAGAGRLLERCAGYPGLVELGQHGLSHANHGGERRPYEFGPARGAEQQHRDIAEGRRRMGALFGGAAAAVFTPPFYGYDRHTLEAVDALGFAVFSGGPTRPFERRRYSFCEVSVTIDPIATYRPRITYKPPGRLVSEVLGAARGYGYLGIILHHDLLTPDAYRLLDGLLAALADAPAARLRHLSEYAQVRGASPRRLSPRLAAVGLRSLLARPAAARAPEPGPPEGGAERSAPSEEAHHGREPGGCAICGHAGRRAAVRQRDLLLGGGAVFHMVRCLGCGALYQHPRPPAGATGEHYPTSYPVYTRPVDEERWLRRAARRYGLAKRVGVVARHAGGGRLLDVGCATGDFLGELRRRPGWAGVGLEPVRAAAEAAGRAGLSCVRAWPEAAPFAPGSFSAITLWDSLNTFADPRRALGELAGLLRPGGALVINHVNLASLDRRLFGEFWCGYDLPRHRHLLPAELLEALLAEHALAPVERGCRYGSHSNAVTSLRFALEGTLGRSPLTAALERALRSLPCRLLAAPLFLALDRLGRGSNITVVFRKGPGSDERGGR